MDGRLVCDRAVGPRGNRGKSHFPGISSRSSYNIVLSASTAIVASLGTARAIYVDSRHRPDSVAGEVAELGVLYSDLWVTHLANLANRPGAVVKRYIDSA